MTGFFTVLSLSYSVNNTPDGFQWLRSASVLVKKHLFEERPQSWRDREEMHWVIDSLMKQETNRPARMQDRRILQVRMSSRSTCP